MEYTFTFWLLVWLGGLLKEIADFFNPQQDAHVVYVVLFLVLFILTASMLRYLRSLNDMNFQK